jgi:hypothetical protein
MNMLEVVAYQLIETGDHLRNLPDVMDREYGEIEDFDVVIYEPTKPKGADSTFLERVVPYDGPEPINFLGFLDRLPDQTDFLNNELLWTIISRRTLYLLKSICQFSHKEVPINIYDYRLKDSLNNYLEIEDLSPEVCNRDYVILQLLETVDAVDVEYSKFEEVDLDDSDPPEVTQLILREPKNGFPPIFRLANSDEFSTSYFRLYLSLAAKEVLENAAIKGIRFIPKEGFKAGMIAVN